MNNIIDFNTKRDLLRAKDVCVIFNIARSTVDSWVNQGLLTKHKIGKKLVYFDKNEVEKLKNYGVV